LDDCDRDASLARAFFGFFLDEMLGENYQAENLGPFGDDVADDLAPFGVGIHFDEGDDPGYARDDQENAEAVIAEEGAGGRADVVWWAAAFGGLLFVEVFCGEDGDDDAGPVGDGVAEEGA
jgi:hypothetical protein